MTTLLELLLFCAVTMAPAALWALRDMTRR